jgi:ADP-ribose pyrophosphatase YjhB (NUDIX family)
MLPLRSSRTQPRLGCSWSGAPKFTETATATGCCPGGEIDPGETPFVVACRELQEESGYEQAFVQLTSTGGDDGPHVEGPAEYGRCSPISVLLFSPGSSTTWKSTHSHIRATKLPKEQPSY